MRHGEEKVIGLAVCVRKNHAAGAVGVPHAWDDAVVFVRVNQVLVRLWARETAMGQAQAWSGGSSVDRSYRLTGCCGILRSSGEGSEALERSVGAVVRRGRRIVCCVLSKSVRRRRMTGAGASLGSGFGMLSEASAEDGFCAWWRTGFRACPAMLSKRRAFGGCLGTRRR